MIDLSSVLGLIPVQTYPFPQKDLLIESLPRLRKDIEAAAEKGVRYAISDVSFDSPVANPSKIVGAPVNYGGHIAERKGQCKYRPWPTDSHFNRMRPSIAP